MQNPSSNNHNARVLLHYRSPEIEWRVQPESAYNRLILTLFLLFSLYLVLPLVGVPFLGLSISAPIFFVIAIVCIFKPPKPWFRIYRGWIILAILIWIGIFISAAGNGVLSGGMNLDTNGIKLIIQYAYWLLVFVITAYFSSQGKVLQTVSSLLGWGVMVLALLRWGEAIIHGSFGAGTASLFTENTYGFQFSVFSPFLLVLMIQQSGWKRVLAGVGYILLLGAAAINGSRGSWIAIAVGVVSCLFLLSWSSPGKFFGLLVMLMLVGGMLSAAWLVMPQVYTNKVLDRFNTLQKLNDDKSYVVRQVLIQKGVRLFEQSPIIGVGVGRFTQSSVPLDIPALLSYVQQYHLDVKSAHNSYVDFLAESGLVGVIPFAVLLALLALQGLFSVQIGARHGRYAALPVFLAFIQMSVSMWSVSTLTNTSNWFIYGLLAAVIMANKKQIAMEKEAP